MALGPWVALYTTVQQDLMLQRRDPELLVLMAIAGHCDPFGMCFPGRKTLLRLRHCSKAKLLEREEWLQVNAYIRIVETWDYRRRQLQIDYQVSPCVMYVRPEVQEYCESVFTGQERDFNFETTALGNLFSTKDSLEIAQGNLLRTKDSQPESLPRIRNQNQNPDSGINLITKHNNQLSPLKGEKPVAPIGLHESQKPEQPPAGKQPPARQNRKNHPQAGPDEFDALLHPDVEDDRIAKEIEIGVGTTPHQAAQAVADYPRELLIEWLRKTVQRRAKGTLTKPGGWFFKMLQKHNPLIALQPGNPDSVVPYYGEMEI